MRILNLYIFREIIPSAFIGTLLATSVIFLQGSRHLFELVVRSSASWDTVLYILALATPPLLPMTIPFGVLVGILIGLGRMSSDGEITAMRAAGISSRSVIVPVLAFAFLATLLAGYSSIRLTPVAWRQTTQIFKKLAASQLTAEIQPRIFEEQFPKTILYVGDVRPGEVVVWRNVFMADLTPPEQRTVGLREKAEGPLITVAREALAVPDPEHNRIQLSLRDASTHEVGKDGVAYDISYPRGEQAVEATPPTEAQTPSRFRAMNTRELSRHASTGPDWVEARIELHRRLALPLGCIALALVGIPLGISSRKGGKSSGYVTAVFLAFFCYWLAFISLISLAEERAIPVEVAAWTPNIAFAIAGLILTLRLESPGGHDVFAGFKNLFGEIYRRLRSGVASAAKAGSRRTSPGVIRLPLLPQIVDTYVLSNFLFYFLLLLASFVVMAEIYNFFDLLGDIVRNKIALSKVFTYLFFLSPKLIYDTLPISVLVAVLVTFGILTKQNEVTAFKACGVSLHRLAAPILVAGVLLSGALFAFDHYYVPEANLKQDALRNEIKGRAVQTYLRPDRKWIFGSGSRIYYYKYFDTVEDVMAGVSVYELEPKTFRLVRQISAERAEWQPSLRTWIFQNGWSRDFRGNDAGSQNPINRFQVTTFPELDEPPGYFFKELKQDKQMNFLDLEQYIGDLQQSGFDTVRLRVQFYRKFSVPLFALIMAMISVPFSFLVGNRGAMAGIAISIGIAIAYWGISQLFEQVGNVNLLPPALAAWSPDALFSLTGLYLMLRMRS